MTTPPEQTRPWRHPDFLKLWTAQVTSLAGTQVSALAVPLTAVVTLDATPTEMGIQSMLWTSGTVVAAFLVGPWIDRLPRRRIMRFADVGRAVLLGSVPLAALLGVLTIEHLWAVTFLFSALTVVFDVGGMALLPALLQRRGLIEGNSALESSRSVVMIAGPGVAGPVVQWLTAPMALLVDVVSYVLSALLLGRIHVSEHRISSPRQETLWTQSLAGIGFVLRHPVLRILAASSGTFVFFLQFFTTLQILYLVRELGITPTVIGALGVVGGTASLGSALLAGKSTRRLGGKRIMMAGLILSGMGSLMIPLASGEQWAVIGLLLAGTLLNGFGSPAYNINTTSLRQMVTPDNVLGRVNATTRLITSGATPVAALLAGLLAERIGVRVVLGGAAIGQMLSCLWLLRLQDSSYALEDPPARKR